MMLEISIDCPLHISYPSRMGAIPDIDFAAVVCEVGQDNTQINETGENTCAQSTNGGRCLGLSVSCVHAKILQVDTGSVEHTISAR